MPATLLLASDSLAVRQALELAFPGDDMHVVAVANGREAIDRLVADPPDIVLAGVTLEVRDGYEVAAFVKETPHLAGIPVLLLAGRLDSVDEARARRVGCAGSLVEPLQPQLVAASVRELLSSRRTKEPATSGSASDTPAAGDAGATTGSPAAAAAGGDYLDRLDAAFAAMSGSARPAARRSADAWPAPDMPEELETPCSPGTPERPPAPQRAPAFALPDSLVDDIARLVIARLGDDQMRREVRDAAERLVREEIDRIKGLRRRKDDAS